MCYHGDLTVFTHNLLFSSAYLSAEHSVTEGEVVATVLTINCFYF